MSKKPTKGQRVKKVKKVRKSSKSRGRAPRNDIGVLSAISFDGELLKSFEKGLGGTPRIESNLGYDSKAIDAALDRLKKLPGMKLIVTVGGLVTALRAAAGNQPFISLVGDSDSLTSNKDFRGAVDLESFKRNSARISGQNQFLKGGEEVGLLSNLNSSMRSDEQANWPNKNIVTIDVNTGTKSKDLPAIYQGAFSSFSASVKAVIVSADPFFTQTASDLVKAADAWVKASGGRVCYPLFEYGDSSPKGKHTKHGPILLKEFEKLGKKAKHVASHIADPWTIDVADQKTEHH